MRFLSHRVLSVYDFYILQSNMAIKHTHPNANCGSGKKKCVKGKVSNLSYAELAAPEDDGNREITASLLRNHFSKRKLLTTHMFGEFFTRTPFQE